MAEKLDKQEEIFILELQKKIADIIDIKFGSQNNLAKTSGLSQSTIHRWVNGKNLSALYNIKKLSEAAEISLDYLVLGKSFESHEVSPDLFNEVYYIAYKWATDENIPVNGTFFLGIYDMVEEELKKGNKEPIEKIIDKLKPTILKLRK